MTSPLRTVLQIGTWETLGRAAPVAILALFERLLAPAVVYSFFRWGQFRGLLLGALLGVVLAGRGAIQRSVAARNEADLYIRVVNSVICGDVLQASVLPDEEARGSLFQGLNRIGLLLAEGLPNLVANVLAATILAVTVAVWEPVRVTLVAATSLALGGTALVSMRGWAARAQGEAWTAWGSVADAVADACDGRLDLVAGGCDATFLDRFGAIADGWCSRARRAGHVAGLSGRLPLAMLGAAVGLAIVADAWLHDLSWAAVPARAALLASYAPPFVGIGQGLQDLVTNQPRLALLARVLQVRRTPVGDGTPPPSSPRLIELRAVDFAYAAGGPDALRSVSLAWRVGEVLGIAGPNGSGKTTCLRALLALGEPRAGCVFVDGAPLSTFDSAQWRHSIGFLAQRPYLPPRATVRECIRFIDADLSEAAMVQALERVGLLGKLGRTAPKDPLGVRAGTLSVGERQRIALARVLCRRSPMVILDEPDANLDREGIQLVERLVKELARESMVLVVAHTPEILGLAARVITLEGGGVRSDVSRESDSRGQINLPSA